MKVDTHLFISIFRKFYLEKMGSWQELPYSVERYSSHEWILTPSGWCHREKVVLVVLAIMKILFEADLKRNSEVLLNHRLWFINQDVRLLTLPYMCKILQLLKLIVFTSSFSFLILFNTISFYTHNI